MSKPQLRKPRFRRIPQPDPVRLTERDILLFTLVSEHRLLQSHQLLKLVPGSEQHLIRRLGRLYHAGFMERPEIRPWLDLLPRQTFVYRLASQGRTELLERGFQVFPNPARSRDQSPSFSLVHDAFVSEVVVAVRAAAVASGFDFRMRHQTAGNGSLSAMHWKCWISVRGDSKSCWVIPDAAFSVGKRGEEPAWFFLEYDRGTMPATRRNLHQTSFLRKVLAYKETRRAGVLWKRDRIPGFRVLVVAESRQRLESLQRVTSDAFHRGESNMFLFVTLGDLLCRSSPSASVWRTCSGKKTALFPVA